jgi:hypothetical protein
MIVSQSADRRIAENNALFSHSQEKLRSHILSIIPLSALQKRYKRPMENSKASQI